MSLAVHKKNPLVRLQNIFGGGGGLKIIWGAGAPLAPPTPSPLDPPLSHISALHKNFEDTISHLITEQLPSKLRQLNRLFVAFLKNALYFKIKTPYHNKLSSNFQ